MNNDPSLMDWLFNKENPSDNKDNSSKVKMSSHSNPKTVSFALTPATDQSLHSTITHTKTDDMIMKIAMDDIFVMKLTLDNNNSPNNKDNSPDNKKFSVPYTKIGKFVKKLKDKSPFHSSHSSTTHNKNTNIPENNNIFTPTPPTSHETYTICTDQVMTNKYISSEPYGSVSSLFGYPPPPKPSPNTFNSTTSTSSTKSERKIREQRQKHCNREARDKHTRNLEQKVKEL